MLNIVVISRNQKEDIDKMSDILKEYNVIYVLDRTYDGTAKLLKHKGCKYIRTPFWWIGRRTSSARNLGLKYCDPKSDVIFLDGDRYPISGNFNDVEKADVLLFKVENDFRNQVKDIEKFYGCVSNFFFSCGIMFKRKIINQIEEEFGELFPTKVENGWGCEDLLLGDICSYLGVKYKLSNKIILNGKFDNKNVDHKMLVRRFKIREKLNLKF